MKLLKINNMRKFRLRKEYPGSPELNSIHYLNTSGGGKKDWLHWRLRKDNFGNPYILEEPWNYPEFWQEIVEKDYEILMYRSKINTDIYFDNPEYFSRLNSDWEIYSIRRKSDGVEFKIGDKICWNWAFAKNKYFTIKSFNIIEDKLRFNTVEESGQNFIFELVSKEYNLQHYKEPILTTEDGYECTLDDRVFGVLPKANWQTNFDDGNGIPIQRLIRSEGFPNTAWLYFKTKENAEKYIYENKPEFSRKQIWSWFRETPLVSHPFWNAAIDEFLK
jgi:hypothetical protein